MLEIAGRWVDESRRKGAFWMHDGDPHHPHLVLPSGEHVNGWFEAERVAEEPVLLHGGAVALMRHLQTIGLDVNLVTRALGVGKGGAGLAHTAAHVITYNRPSDRTGEVCLSSHIEEEPFGSFDRRATTHAPRVERGEYVMLLAASFSPAPMRFALESVERSGARSARFVGALANLSGMEMIGRHKVGALISRQIIRWGSQESCPLCAQGSEAINPQSRADWKRLAQMGAPQRSL